MAPGSNRAKLLLVLISSCLPVVHKQVRANETGHSNEPARPNVLFLAVDDMKDWVGCLGGYEGKVHTPNIDALANRGVLFTNAHCASPKCAPSRAAVMTSLRPSTTGLYDNGHWWLPNLPGAVTIPKHFQRHGYQVVGAGKIFHHTAGNNPPSQWDDFLRLTFRNDPWFRSSKLNYPWSEAGPDPPGFPFSNVVGLGHENDWGSLPVRPEDYDDALTADYAIQFLREPHDRPFFLACGIFRPHLPWYVPQAYFDRYPLEEVRVPPTPEDDLADVPTVGLDLARARRKDLRTIEEAGKRRQAIRAYLASITYADAQLGRVLSALDETAARKQTIVVLWSDHGWHLGEKQHWHKSTLWEESTRVPLVIALPDSPGGRCDLPASLVDLFPTLNDLCRLEHVDGLDGHSLQPLLEKPATPWPEWNRPAIIEFRKGNVAVRTERYRYVQYQDGGEELYDHNVDASEWHNLARRADMRQIVTELAALATKQWADPASTKKAFTFDPHNYRWIEKRTGRVIDGKRR